MMEKESANGGFPLLQLHSIPSKHVVACKNSEEILCQRKRRIIGGFIDAHADIVGIREFWS
jgi:hypothetical protein